VDCAKVANVVVLAAIVSLLVASVAAGQENRAVAPTVQGAGLCRNAEGGAKAHMLCTCESGENVATMDLSGAGDRGGADMAAGWGFAALVTFRGHRVLFDAGRNPQQLLENLHKMDVDPTSIEHVVISHHHSETITNRGLPV